MAQCSLVTVETWLFTGIMESVYFDGKYSSNIGKARQRLQHISKCLGDCHAASSQCLDTLSQHPRLS